MWLIYHPLVGKLSYDGILIQSLIVTHNDPFWKMDLYPFQLSFLSLCRDYYCCWTLFDNQFTLPRLSLCFAYIMDLSSEVSWKNSQMTVILYNYYNYTQFQLFSPSNHLLFTSQTFPMSSMVCVRVFHQYIIALHRSCGAGVQVKCSENYSLI